MNVFTSSRTFSTAIVIGLLTVMLAGYQNCGKASFQRSGSDDPGKPNCTNSNSAECRQGTAEVIPLVQNGGSVSIGDQESTCKGLTADDISNGKNRDISINLMAINFIPVHYFCLRVAPITDNAHYKCNLPNFPGQTYRPDGGEPTDLGDYFVTSTDNSSVQLKFDDVVNGAYELEFHGQGGPANNPFRTNPVRVRFVVNDCPNPPLPSPQPSPVGSPTPSPNPSPSMSPSPSPSPTGSPTPTPSISPSPSPSQTPAVSEFWIMGVMSMVGDANPDGIMTNPDRMDPVFVVTNGHYPYYRVNVEAGTIVTAMATIKSILGIQDPWLNCVNKTVQAVVINNGANAKLELPGCVFKPDINNYNVSAWGLMSQSDTGNDNTASENQHWNFMVMPGTTPPPSCQPGFYNTEAECEVAHGAGKCEPKFVCVQEPCNCSWGPIKVDQCPIGKHLCVANPPPTTLPPTIIQCVDSKGECCKLGYDGGTFEYDGQPLVCAPPTITFKVQGVYKPSYLDFIGVDNIVDNALENTNDDPVFKISKPVMSDGSKPGINSFKVQILNPRMGMMDVVLCEKTINNPIDKTDSFDLNIAGCHLENGSSYRARISAIWNSTEYPGDPNPFTFDVKGPDVHSCVVCPASCAPGKDCINLYMPCYEYKVSSESECCSKVGSTTGAAINTSAVMPIEEIILPSGSEVTYDGKPLVCGGSSCPSGYYPSMAECEAATGKKCISEFECVRAPCCSWTIAPAPSPSPSPSPVATPMPTPNPTPVGSFNIRGVYRPANATDKAFDTVVDNILSNTYTNPVFRISAPVLPNGSTMSGGLLPEQKTFEVILRTDPNLSRGVEYCKESIVATALPTLAFVGAVPEFDLRMTGCKITYGNPVYAMIKYKYNSQLISGNPTPFIFNVIMQTPVTCPAGYFASKSMCEGNTGRICELDSKISCDVITCVTSPCTQPECCNWKPIPPPVSSCTTKTINGISWLNPLPYETYVNMDVTSTNWSVSGLTPSKVYTVSFTSSSTSSSAACSSGTPFGVPQNYTVPLSGSISATSALLPVSAKYICLNVVNKDCALESGKLGTIVHGKDAMNPTGTAAYSSAGGLPTIQGCAVDQDSPNTELKIDLYDMSKCPSGINGSCYVGTTTTAGTTGCAGGGRHYKYTITDPNLFPQQANMTKTISVWGLNVDRFGVQYSTDGSGNTFKHTVLQNVTLVGPPPF